MHLLLSELAQLTIAAELDRHRKVAVLNAYLAGLDDQLGPATPDQIAEADAWADKLARQGSQHQRKSRTA